MHLWNIDLILLESGSIIIIIIITTTIIIIYIIIISFVLFISVWFICFNCAFKYIWQTAFITL